MITEVTLTDIQDFIVRSVATSTEFNDLCLSSLGTDMTYYRGSDLSKAIEATPYFMSYKFNSQDVETQNSSWVLQYIIAIDGNSEPIVDSDGITLYEDSDTVETLATKALDIIKDELRSGGLGGICTIRIVDVNILVTEIGEADDVQAIVTLRLENYKTL